MKYDDKHSHRYTLAARTRSKKQDKQTKLIQNISRMIQQFLGGKGYQPLPLLELMDRLVIPEDQHPLFKEALLSLIERDVIQVQLGRYLLKEESMQIVSGILRVHPRGFGFLQPNDPIRFPQDIFIPKHLTKNAVDGDLVEVLVDESAYSEKGPEGKVTAIIKRGRTHVAGTILFLEPNDTYSAYVPLLGQSKRVLVSPRDERPLKEGDRIIMKVVDWGSDSAPTICEMSHYIGHISDPSCDVPAAVEEFEIRNDFSARVLKEAKAHGNKVSVKEIKNREDLRKIECFTIDPDTAKDYDDALSLKVDSHGHYHLGVHIADVSHYVSQGSALDLEAKLRCNSTYFPGQCIPMLPHELSNELCSLKPNVNRLTLSVLVEIDQEGTVVKHRIVRSVIKSAKRFTYKEAKLVLDGKKRSKHAATLSHMVKLCHLLKKKRSERGSIEFALTDTIVIVDEQGRPTGVEKVQYDITHQLVEEFMLKANEIVATHLSANGQKVPYRVHDDPSEDNLREFGVLARAYGFHFPKDPEPKDFQILFDQAVNTPYGPQLATSFIRSMKLAYYSPTNAGHYGLSLDFYCHFTSPIRRYIDLVVHRIVCGDDIEHESLDAVAHACSEQERISARAEQSVLLLKKLRLLQKIHEENPSNHYDAVVTRVKNMGVSFDIPELMLDGFLHISELDNDYFVYEERSLSLRGTRTQLSYSCGKPIKVALLSINFITLESKWSLVSKQPRHPSSSSKKRRRANRR